MTTQMNFEKILHDIESPSVSLSMLLSLLADHPPSEYKDLPFLARSLDSLEKRLAVARDIAANLDTYTFLSENEKTQLLEASDELERVDTEIKRIRALKE